jgi:probable HAF family extracellular repeat protein
MKMIAAILVIGLSSILFTSPCFAQMYTVTDLGSLNPTGINRSGQIVGNLNGHAFMWTESTGLNDLGVLPGGTFSSAAAINDLGSVTGTADGFGIIDHSPYGDINCGLTEPFLWTPGAGMQGLGVHWTGGFTEFDQPCPRVPFYATDINTLRQIVGYTHLMPNLFQSNFLWTESDGMSVFGGWPPTFANGINNLGQIVGNVRGSYQSPQAAWWKNSEITYLVPSDGSCQGPSVANAVSDWGLIVGWTWCRNVGLHAVVWTPTGTLRDLGTLPGDLFSTALKVNFFGEVIGSSGNTTTGDDVETSIAAFGRPFIWSEVGGMKDLNALIRSDMGWTLSSATAINILGQIVGQGIVDGQPHGYLLTPIYKGLLQPPIKADGSSVFSSKRGVVPVKFALAEFGAPSCALPEATISVTRTEGATLGSIDESTYLTNADGGSNFRIDSTACQYVYNLATSSLGVGAYQVNISINGIMVGHAVFALK